MVTSPFPLQNTQGCKARINKILALQQKIIYFSLSLMTRKEIK